MLYGFQKTCWSEGIYPRDSRTGNEQSYFHKLRRLIFKLPARNILVKWMDKDFSCFDFTGLMI
ncbi:hypothetical protein BN128_3705 [Cronobacter sakazakii 696]|nr:hypothetical protein BN128_3705 [Cronobacter sakazakii 696]